jgi:peptide/nickel transport system substrate-binding protein
VTSIKQIPYRPVVLAVVAAFVLAVGAGTAGADSSSPKVTLSVGMSQDVDSMNPAVGALVPDYDIWNVQYATLTDKAASDFHVIPGLATSWKSSNGGKTWTYTMRKGLTWSDGTPLTSADVVYTINRSRKEAWLNYDSTVHNIVASAPNATTVVLRSSVPDPKLPVMDVYIVPKHVYDKVSAKDLPKYPATDGVGSGPFTLDKWVKGQYVRLKANPSYYKGKPAYDEIVLRPFSNLDAMVAALKKGEIDAANNVPSTAFKSLAGTKGIVTVEGQQGGFDELALNGGMGLKNKDGSPTANPALLDLRFRQAIAHAIDKNTLVQRAIGGIGTPADALSPSANPEWVPKIPANLLYDFDLKKANAILDAAGYEDTDGNGVRNLPNGGKDIVLRYAVRSESSIAKPVAEFVTGWLKQIGIGTTTKTYSDSQLTSVVGKGDYDLFTWGWTPFVDPDPELSYFQCDQLAKDPSDPTNYYNDANYCDKAYDALYAKQHVELDHAKRVDIVHQMLTRWYRDAAYVVIDLSPDLQAYRTDRFTGWTRQPSAVGPVLFSNTTPTYFNLKPIEGSSAGGGGLGTPAIGAIGVAVVALLGGLVFWLVRRKSVDERE